MDGVLERPASDEATGQGRAPEVEAAQIVNRDREGEREPRWGGEVGRVDEVEGLARASGFRGQLQVRARLSALGKGANELWRRHFKLD